MRSLQIIFTLLVLVVCARSVSGSDPYNPEPCTDPYTCKNKPILYGSIEGTKAICPGATGSWTLVGGALLGSKEKCKETPVDVTASEYWTYAVTGPEPTSGTGKTFSWAPTQPGDYKITWKGTATASPCDVDPIERTYDFKVYEEEFDPKLNVEKDFAAALEPKLKKVEELINSTFFLSGASLKVTGSLTAKGGRKCCDLK